MVDPTDEDSKFYMIMGVRGACENCAEFVLQCLSGWSFDDFVDRKEDPEEGPHIAQAMQIWHREDKTMCKPCMEAGSLDEIGIEAYEKKSMLNSYQVMKEFSKAPTSLQMQPKWFPSSTGPRLVYLLDRTPEFKLKYPTAKIFIKTADVVQTQKTAATNRKALWDLHPSMVLTGMCKSRETEVTISGEKCNSSMPLGAHVPTAETLKNRTQLLSERYSRRKSRGGSTASTVNSLMDGDDEDGDVDMEDGDELEDGDAEAIVLWRDPDACSPGQSGKPGMKRPSSTRSLRGDGKKSTKADPPPPNPHPLGTAAHWIFEMKFEDALDAKTMQHPFNQAKVLAPKLCQEERDMLLMKRDLCQFAVEINYKVVDSVTDQDCISFMAITDSPQTAKPNCF